MFIIYLGHYHLVTFTLWVENSPFPLTRLITSCRWKSRSLHKP